MQDGMLYRNKFENIKTLTRHKRKRSLLRCKNERTCGSVHERFFGELPKPV